MGVSAYYDDEGSLVFQTTPVPTRFFADREEFTRLTLPVLDGSTESEEGVVYVQVGDTISVDPAGTYSDDATLVYTLRRYDTEGVEQGSDVGTSWVVPDHVGQTLVIEEKATDALGRILFVSTSSVVILPVDLDAIPPVVAQAPTIAGLAAVGETLSVVSSGVWLGEPAPTIATNWQRDGVDIGGATSSTYVLQVADDHTDIRLRATATNASGSATAYSDAIPITTPTIIATQGRSGATLTPFDNAAAGAEAGHMIVLAAFVHNSTTPPPLVDDETWVSPPNGTSASSNSAARLSYHIVQESDADATWTVLGATRAVAAYVKDFYPGDPLSFSGWVASGDSTPDWPAFDVDLAGLMMAFRCIRGSNKPVRVYPGMQTLVDTNNSQMQLQAAVTGDSAPYVTVPTGDLAAYSEVDLGSASQQAHTGLVLINDWSSNVVAPINYQLPTFAGVPTVGQTLTKLHDGLWFGLPVPTYAYQWRRDGASIGGATSTSYVLQAADAGTQVSLQVTATNSQGSAQAAANSVSVAAALVSPVNTAIPTITGTPAVGQTLTAASDGTWTGTPAPTLTRKWQRDGVDIASATASTYLLVTADAGHNVSVLVTGTNASGSSSASSNPVAIPAVTVAPVNTVLPTISGTPTEGQTLTAADGTWTGTPSPTLTRKWQRDGVDIGGATGTTYVLVTADVGTEVRVLVTGTNTAGSSAAASSPVTVAPISVAPSNTAVPTISGTPTVGQTLTATSDGTWTGTPTPTLARNWQRDGVDIGGATGTTYVLQAGDATHQISVLVTATNTAGSATASSTSLTIDPAAQAPVNTVAPTISGTGTVGLTLTRVSDGTWTGTPTPTLARNWQRGGVDIAGATGTTYVLQAADSGQQIRLRVTGTNSQGSSNGFSIATSVTALTAPVNTVAPTISGTGTIGNTLSQVSAGTWTGNPTPTLTRNWQRNGVDIAGATATTYVLQAADGGQNIRLRVTGTNSQGVASGFSIATAVAAAVAPANVSLPAISGTGAVGQTLTMEDAGGWTGTDPITYARNWQRSGVDIVGATGTTYVLQAADAGLNVRLSVTATNIAGSATARSAVVNVAATDVPVNTVLPDITGSAVVGSTLNGTLGTWTGSTPITYARQWQRDGVNISGETSSAYTLVAADAGHNVRVRVVATNSAGSTTAFSAAELIESGASGDWAVVNVTPSNYLTQFRAARTKKTSYRLAAGIYDDFLWPTNITDFEIEIVPQDRNNPPTMRAVAFGANADRGKRRNFAHITYSFGSNFTKKVTFDGIDFIGERWTSCESVLGGTQSFTNAAQGGMPDSGTPTDSPFLAGNEGGIAWRIYGTTHPAWKSGFLGKKESAGYIGLDVNSSVVMEVKNCLFNGYSIQFNFSGNGSINCHHNTFEDVCEDGMKPTSNNVWFHHNECRYSRVPTEEIANASGGPGRPHPDFWQQPSGAVSDLVFEKNVFIDFENGAARPGQMHGALIRNGSSTGRAERVVVRWNEWRICSDSGVLLSDVQHDGGSGINGSNLDLIIEGNKVWTGGKPGSENSGGPQFPFYKDFDASVAAGGTRIRCTNNVSIPNRGAYHGIGTNNRESNSATVWPDNWVEIARDRVGPGQPFSGRYGATAGVPA